MIEGELPGVHVATLDIPEDGVLEFRFLMDGEAEKVLAPRRDKCTSKTAEIVGPEADLTNTWHIKGKPGQEVVIELCVIDGKTSLLWVKH